jgi:carboxybiotin decarboxylase
MKKIFSLLIGLLFLLPVVSMAADSDSEIAEILIKGKWMNKSDGYFAMPIYPENPEETSTVERYKTFSFHSDYSFSLDSAKHEYLGRWRVSDGIIFLEFEPSNVVNYSRNNDPNAVGYFYVATPDVITLSPRQGEIKDGVFKLNDGFEYHQKSGATAGLLKFWEFTGFANAQWGHFIMYLVGLIFIYLAIKYKYEPLLLIPIGTGVIIGNIPMFQAVDFNLMLGVYEPGSVMNILYSGVVQGWYPPLIFLGIGALTDFSFLISKPRLMLLGAAAQFGIFATFLLALAVGFAPAEAGAIGIIGGADGPTAIFLSSKLANGLNIIGYTELGDPIFVKNLIGPIAIAAYSYMALVPVIQPPVIYLLTNKRERRIKMKAPRQVSKLEKIVFPIVGLFLTAFLTPTALPLLGMLFFGNILKESGVTRRLAETAGNALIDTITILLCLTVGASTQADIFLTTDSVMIFIMGAISFIFATAAGVIFAKIMNWFSPKDNPINPMIGAAGVSAVPDSARVVQELGHKEDPTNFLLMHAMAPNVSGVIGSAIAAGVLLSFLM